MDRHPGTSNSKMGASPRCLRPPTCTRTPQATRQGPRTGWRRLTDTWVSRAQQRELRAAPRRCLGRQGRPQATTDAVTRDSTRMQTHHTVILLQHRRFILRALIPRGWREAKATPFLRLTAMRPLCAEVNRRGSQGWLATPPGPQPPAIKRPGTGCTVRRSKTRFSRGKRDRQTRRGPWTRSKERRRRTSTATGRSTTATNKAVTFLPRRRRRQRP